MITVEEHSLTLRDESILFRACYTAAGLLPALRVGQELGLERVNWKVLLESGYSCSTLWVSGTKLGLSGWTASTLAGAPSLLPSTLFLYHKFCQAKKKSNTRRETDTFKNKALLSSG